MRTLSDGHRLLVGTELGQWQGFRNQIVRALFWSFTVLLAISGFGGWLVSRHVTRRLEVINRTTRTIIDGHLHARIPRSPNDDELDRLAANLNDMLEQIEGLMAGLRDLSEDIAHDLRTPLNRLRGQLELALSEAGEEGPVRDLIQEAIAEADRLLDMFGALLSIAKAQAGYQQMPLTDVALPPVLRRVVELYEPVAEEKHIALTVRITVPAVVRGHEQLLAQALANLVDNAVKYTPDGGRIDVTVASGQEPGTTDVVVADSGIGIPIEEHERVLGRFIRLDWSRSTPGNGLGLALVDAVVRLHGARLVMEDNSPGLRVRLRFPNISLQETEHECRAEAGEGDVS
nr:ATP-binding protein [Azospirillum sp. A1-3]